MRKQGKESNATPHLQTDRAVAHTRATQHCYAGVQVHAGGATLEKRARLDWAMGKLASGEMASEFELPDSTGAPRQLSELVSQGHAVLLFYRGNW
jgi:hypothetical protein